jgi:two-component system, OmpR family, sensor kinase
VTRLPIRLRLTLVFSAGMAVVLLGAGLLVYSRVASDLAASLDQQLRRRADDVSALVAGGGSLDATRGPLIEPGESFAEVVTAQGRVVDATRPIGQRLLLSPAELGRAERGPTFVNRASVPGLDEPARLLALPLARGGRRLVLVVGATREDRAETLSSLRAAFLIGGPLALLLTSLGGYALAGAALRPIEAMRRRAAEISVSALDERLPADDTRDEVGRLGTTLNEMLARLEDGVARERSFVADASHELRTPLALLAAELDLALRGDRSREELERAIQSAADDVARIARLANDLLLLATAEQGRLPLEVAPTDVLDVLHTVVGRFEQRARKAGRALSVDGAEPLVVVADRLRLEQAVTNMLDNALRHGGGAVAVGAVARNGAAELHVVDGGGGLPPELGGRAFERFSRAGPGEGSGLGLAIVETIARAHGGEAHVENRPEGGADQWISVPAADRPL